MADCNGDGTINSIDVLAIAANFGNRHNNHNNRSGMGEATPADPSMYIDVIPSAANEGSTVTASIYLGTSSIPVDYLYGYSFTLNYNPALVVPGSMNISTANNWLGNTNNELVITHDDNVNGKLDLGVVRFDKVQLTSGYGLIATVTFQLRPNVSGNLNLTLSPSAKVLTTTMYGNTTAGNTEIFMPVNLVGDELQVLNPTGITNTIIDNTITFYPNPANDIITINTGDVKNAVVEFYDISGRKLFAQKLANSITPIDLTMLTNGIYTCHIVSGAAEIKREKVIICR